MALVTTVGGASADSYLSIAEADALAAARLIEFADEWLELDDDDRKEQALRQATADIDVHVGTTDRWSDLQALLFPRALDVDAGDVPFLYPRILEATFAQAAFLHANHEVLEAAAIRRARGLFSFSEDNVSGTLAIDSQVGRMSPRAISLLAAIPSTGLTTLASIPIQTEYNVIDALAAAAE